MNPTITTHSGSIFDFTQPELHAFDINDIAHALSHQCRFTGHTEQFYSVAQHSVLVSYAVSSEFAMQGLLHDAAEAYMGDLSSPLKALLPEYKIIENRVEAALLKFFRLPPTLDPCIKRADLTLLLTEQRDLMPDKNSFGIFGIEPLAPRIVPWPPQQAKNYFLLRFLQIKEQQHE